MSETAVRFVSTWAARTLGIFATHLLVLWALQRATGTWPDGATSIPGMLALTVGAVVLSAVVTAVLRRVPWTRSLV